MAPGPQHLIFDADDTLWENNIYFERAFEDFADFLGHSKLDRIQIRAVLDEIETINAKIHGYGSLNFGRNLRQTYERLVEREIHPDDLTTVIRFAERILEQPLELIEGVEETLADLTERHELTVFTKGHPEEQRLKIERSGLARYFGHVEIVKEKDRESYERLVLARGFKPARTWMIGNSPKSDINPALDAGLNAVFIPHPHTWVLERQDIRAGKGRLIHLETFRALQEWF
ncbi:MAG TPA: HAD hydrolase-like protein [Bryobacteraceae bacterium]|nr:HAD hydrolase-like protein [Bryobacteraceae bacterium]